VLAANEGQVALAEPLTVRGKAVIIAHGLGIHSGYYHLSEINVQEGQPVRKGDVVGKVGDTGLATGPHLWARWVTPAWPPGPISIGKSG